MNAADLAARALTQRAAAALLAKSPVWSLLADFMTRQLAALENDILNNGTLAAQVLEQRRNERLFLRQILTSFANQFRSAFTAPPPSEDETLQPRPVPPEVEAALHLLLQSSPRLPVSPSPSLQVSPSDPRPIDPFTGTRAPA